MSGLLNSTGAVSGILGTTVGTPSSNAADIGAGVLPVGVTGGSGLANVPTGVTHYDMWRITTGFSGDHNPVSANWERADVPPGFGLKGAAMSVSSGYWTFPVTGLWLIFFYARYYSNNNAGYLNLLFNTTTDNSTYALAAPASGMSGLAGAYRQLTAHHYIFDVTSTTDCKCAYQISHAAASNEIAADTNNQTSGMTFIRLGDS